MHKSRSSACSYACHNPRSLYSNCYCNQPTMPRHCTSCILTNLRKDDEWKLYKRCLTGFYVKNPQPQFHTQLWRKAERERAKAVSMMDLTYKTKISKKKLCKRVARPAEIVIERQTESVCGGLLGSIASKPTCIDHRLAQLLMQQKLREKCNCDPYESVPDVPLAFYPKWTCSDSYGNDCDDEYVQMLANAICSESGRGLKVNEGVSKTFLKRLNKLYAHVGGGSDGHSVHTIHNRRKHRHFDMDKEFTGFFGEPAYKRNTEKLRTRSFTSTVVGVDYLSNKIRSKFQLQQSEELYPLRRSFRYPTKISEDKRPHMKLDAKDVKKYLAMPHRSSHITKSYSSRKITS